MSVSNSRKWGGLALILIAGMIAGGLLFLQCADWHRGDGAEHFQYFADGKLKSRTTPDGVTIAYDYNPAGRLTGIKYGGSAVTFGYDALHYLQEVRSREGSISLGRDAFERVVQIAIPSGRKIHYEYDPWGRVIAQSISGGPTTRYAYDLLGRITGIDSGEGRVTYEYRPNQTRRTLPNGVVTTYSFSPGGNLEAIRHERAAGSLICAYRYTYEADRRLSSVEETSPEGSISTQYEYDLLGRLIVVKLSNGQRFGYTYDAAGNRTSETGNGATLRYQYDGKGRLVRKGATGYRYDKSGHLIAKQDSQSGRSTTYEYNDAGLLTEVRSGGVRVRYSYDGLGNRIQREAGGKTTYFLNDPVSGRVRVAGEYAEGGNPVASYLYGDSVLARRDSRGQTVYYLADRLGSIRYVVDGRGDVLRKSAYDPFGQPQTVSAADGDSPGFAGQMWDCDAGLIFLQARYYDPSDGRFLSRDPVRGAASSPQSLNRYAYARNDPVNFTDVTGLSPVPVRNAPRLLRVQDDGYYGGGSSYSSWGSDLSSAPPPATEDYNSSSTQPLPAVGSQTGVAQAFLNSNPTTPPPLQFPDTPSLWDQVKSTAQQAYNSVSNAASNAMQAVSPSVQAAGQALGDIFGIGTGQSGAAQAAQNALSQALGTVAPGSSAWANAIGNLSPEALSGLTASDVLPALGAAGKAMGSTITGPLSTFTGAVNDFLNTANNYADQDRMGTLYAAGKGLLPLAPYGEVAGPLIGTLEAALPKGVGDQVGSSATNYGLNTATGGAFAAADPFAQFFSRDGPALQVEKSAMNSALNTATGGAFAAADPIARFFSPDGPALQVERAAVGAGLSTALPGDPAQMFSLGFGPDALVSAAQPPVGGVRLDKAAELVGNLGSLVGAVYDPETGRVVLVGEKRTSLPPMRLDDLAVALRAAYSDDPHDISMTIDPDPRNPMGPSMNVIFFGNTQNTHLGAVMFEADRIMKAYSAGRDNVTKAPIQSGIPGYMNLLQLMTAGSGKGYQPHLWSRFWLVPDRVQIYVSPDGKSIGLGQIKMRVKTETMRLAGGKLVPAGGEKDESAECFAQHFTEHYNDFVKENPVYGELRRLAQVVAIAKWMKASGIPLDPRWVESAASSADETPQTTPSVANFETRSWKTGATRHTETVRVFGGADLGVTAGYRRNAPRVGPFGALIRSALRSAPDPSGFEVVVNGRNLRAVSVPVTQTPRYGSFTTARLDLAAGTGRSTVLLQRHYSSFSNAPTAFGRSWSLLLPRLYIQGSGAKGHIETVSVAGKPNSAVRLQAFHLVDDFGLLDQRFTEQFIDPEWARIGFRPTGGSALYRGVFPNADGTYWLVFANHDHWLFSREGRLIYQWMKGAEHRYAYEKDGARLVAIAGLAAGRINAWIRFSYDASGRIVTAHSSDRNETSYAYDNQGDLASVTHGRKTLSYGYDASHLLVSEGLDGKLLLQNRYDPSGAWTGQVDDTGKTISEQKIELGKDGSQTITGRFDSQAVTRTYDAQMRLTAIQTAAGAKAFYTYHETGLIRRAESVDLEGARTVVEFSADHRSIDRTDPRGTRRQLRYREDGRLSQMLIDGRPYSAYAYDEGGRLSSIDYGAFRERFEYNQNGQLMGAAAGGPSDFGLGGQRLTIAYDARGAMSAIGGEGLGDLRVARDPMQGLTIASGEATSQILFDAHGRPAWIHGPGNSGTEYAYGPDGRLTGFRVQHGAQSAESVWQDGLLRESRDFRGGRTRYEYARPGKLRTVTDAYQMGTSLEYDDHGRLSAVAGPGGRRAVYVYDTAGRLSEIRE